MNEILALAAKDLRLLVRDKVGFFFTFVFPVAYASLFGAIMSGFAEGDTKGMKIAVVDQDQTKESAAFVKKLDDAGQFEVLTTDRDKATELVRKGKRVAFVVLPEGFGQARKHMFWGEPARIEAGIDPSRQAEAGMIQGVLTGMLYEGMQEAFTNPEVMTAQVDDALAAIPEPQPVFDENATTGHG